MRESPAYRNVLLAIDSGNLSKAMWYGFGSFFNPNSSFSDIDLLAVCPTPELAFSIREEIATLCNDWPVHLLIMTESEAEETNFIQSQHCIPLRRSESSHWRTTFDESTLRRLER